LAAGEGIGTGVAAACGEGLGAEPVAGAADPQLITSRTHVSARESFAGTKNDDTRRMAPG